MNYSEINNKTLLICLSVRLQKCKNSCINMQHVLVIHLATSEVVVVTNSH